MKTFLTLAAMTLLLSSVNCSYAKDCLYSIKSEDIKLTWTAFKTPLKKGVPGTFKKYGIKKQYQGNGLKSLLESVSFDIDASSVDTNNPARDKKISKFFFGLMDKTNITGKFKSYQKKVLTVNLTMNGVNKDIPMQVITKENEIVATGFIDVLDFSLAKSLAGINKACLELHEGKTWSDVELQLNAKFSKSCK